ncbi:hypothetical protein V1511DRAFT_312960 [Dipodascopsis uninucleata]
MSRMLKLMKSPHANKRSEKANNDKLLTSSVLFPEISKRISENPESVGSLNGLFIFSILDHGKLADEWCLLFSGHNKPPEVFNQAIPSLRKKYSELAIVVIEMEDQNLIKFITGGLTGLKGISTGQIRIAGDVDLALKLEDTFVSAGGIDQTLEFLRQRRKRSSSLSPVPSKL